MRSIFSFVASILIAGLLFFSGNANAAGIPGISGAAATDAPAKLPEPLTKEAVRDMLSTLSDQQVRDLLLQRLDAVAEQKAADNAANQSTLVFLADAILDIGTSINSAVGGLPDISAKAREGIAWLSATYGFAGLVLIAFKAAASIAIGLIAALGFGHLTSNLRTELANAAPERLGPAIRLLAMRLGVNLSGDSPPGFSSQCS
jgi:hypothetical protein